MEGVKANAAVAVGLVVERERGEVGEAVEVGEDMEEGAVERGMDEAEEAAMTALVAPDTYMCKHTT